MAGLTDGRRGSDYNASQPNWVGVGAELGNIPKIPDENGFTQILELRWTKLGATPF